jgi:hypothetical protein
MTDTSHHSDHELESQLRHELSLAFNELGGLVFALVYHRALCDRRLERPVQRIYDLSTRLGAKPGFAER